MFRIDIPPRNSAVADVHKDAGRCVVPCASLGQDRGRYQLPRNDLDWHEAANPECPRSRQVSEAKRTFHRDRESNTYDPGYWWTPRPIRRRCQLVTVPTEGTHIFKIQIKEGGA